MSLSVKGSLGRLNLYCPKLTMMLSLKLSRGRVEALTQTSDARLSERTHFKM